MYGMLVTPICVVVLLLLCTVLDPFPVVAYTTVAPPSPLVSLQVKHILDSIATSKTIRSSLREIATMGVIAGALGAEKGMQEHLDMLTDDLIQHANTTSDTVNRKKMHTIELQMERDKRALQIIATALDLVGVIGVPFNNFRKDLARISREQHLQAIEQRHRNKTLMLEAHASSSGGGGDGVGGLSATVISVNDKINDVKTRTANHSHSLHKMIRHKAVQTVKLLELRMQRAHTSANLKRRNVRRRQIVENNDIEPFVAAMNEINVTKDALSGQDELDKKPLPSLPPAAAAAQITSDDEFEEGDSMSDSESEEQAPGGIVGLLAGLSGGDDGSDVAGLIAAISGVVMNLFGPGGLDVPSLLTTGTSLISALLSGGDNFGSVLAGYVGVSVDGFSGGGGADNNGEFFGSFVGTLFAQLSADPEDEDLPPKPDIFLKNFFKGFHNTNGYNKKSDDVGEHREDSGGGGTKGGSDFFGFITHIVMSVVGGLTSVILNASLGSSGGSSQGSADASGASSSSSSSGHQPGAGDADC